MLYVIKVKNQDQFIGHTYDDGNGPFPLLSGSNPNITDESPMKRVHKSEFPDLPDLEFIQYEAMYTNVSFFRTPGQAERFIAAYRLNEWLELEIVPIRFELVA